MNEFLYREEDHTYWMLEKNNEYVRIPSVTEIIKPILDYSKVPDDVLESARQRGTNIHATFKLWVQGKLDEEQLAEGNSISLDAFKEWWDRERKNFDGLLMDIKTRPPYIPYDSVQLAGYEILLNDGVLINETVSIHGGWIEEPFGNKNLMFAGTPDFVKYNSFHMEKYVLYLKPEGGYEFVNVGRRQAQSMFRKLLKKWWDDNNTDNIIKRWRKTK